MLPLSNTDQCTLSLIVATAILDVYTHYCRTVITNKYVDYWIHGNISLEILCTDYNGWKQPLYARDANSVNIDCHDGGNCQGIMIECPENNLNNSCKIHCDDHPTTQNVEPSNYIQ